MRYVYLLSNYEEHGATGVYATCHKERLFDALLARFVPPLDANEHVIKRYIDEHHEASNGLKKLLLKTDEELSAADGTNLQNGWGGVQLHVVPLDE